MSNITPLRPINTLAVGQVITPTTSDKSVTVLACSERLPARDGTYAVWTVICHLPHNSLHPFAVWFAIDRPEGWAFENGDYCLNLTEALASYASRSGGEIG